MITKKLSLTIAVSAVALTFSAFAPKAFAVVDTDVIQGVVSAANSSPSVGANVTATCNGHTYTGTTNGFGFYQIFTPTTPVEECPNGMTVVASAVNGSEHGSNSGLMQHGTGVGQANLDIALIPIQMVPEFGMLTGVVASLVSGGLFLLKRKTA